MKIAISNIAWDRSEDEAIAQLMQQYGVLGLDVAPGKLAADPLSLSDTAITTYLDFWKVHGIQIIGMQSMLYGHPELKLFASAEARQQTSDYLKTIIRLAAKLGVTPLVFGSPKNRQIGTVPLHLALDIATEFFFNLAQYAHEHHTILCLEPNPPQYNCDFITNSHEALQLVKRVNHPGFRLHLDSAIMTMNGENIEKTLADAIEWLAHFHVSEPQLGVVQAEGQVDHSRFAKQLRKLGYDEWVSIEMRGGWTQPDADSVAKALAFGSLLYAS